MSSASDFFPSGGKPVRPATVYTSGTGTHTFSPKATWYRETVIGGGNGGDGGGDGTYSGGKQGNTGGASCATVKRWKRITSATLPYSVGAAGFGGTGGKAPPGNSTPFYVGTAGGQSSFGTTVSLPNTSFTEGTGGVGGIGGYTGTSANGGRAGGPNQLTVLVGLATPGLGSALPASGGGAGADSEMGVGGNGGNAASSSGANGLAGQNASGYGAGGGGGGCAGVNTGGIGGNGGNGSPGRIDIEEFA